MFKRGVLVLVLAAMLAVLSSQVAAENREVSIQSSLKNPVVQSVKQHKGKISVVLKDEDTDEKEVMDIDVSELDDEGDDDDEETEEKKVAKVVKKAHRKDADDDDDDDDDEDEDEEEKKKVVKKAHKKAVKKAHRKGDTPDDEAAEDDDDDDDDEDEEVKKAHKKAHKAHKKQVSVEKKDNGEIVKNYPGGSVRIMGKSAPKKAHKKAHKKQAPPANATEPAKNATTVTKDVDLEAGESVLLEFGGHVLNLTVAKNGSLIVDADNQTYVLPEVDEADVVFNGDFELDEKKNKNSTAVVPAANVTTAPSMMKMVKRDIALAAKKFSELATTVTADTVSKDAAPIVFVCGLVGALAAIIGVAAVALGRVRHDDATEDPQSVLADEAVEDVEAGIQASTEEEKKDEDAPAEKSDSLSDSDSDSEVEEGTFANDKNAASV